MTKVMNVRSEAIEAALPILETIWPEKPRASSSKAISSFRHRARGQGKPTPLRWSCHHRAEASDIEAWVPAQNGLAVIGQTRRMEGVSAEANAELITQAVNEYHKLRPLIIELVEALEQCLTTDELTWAAEQEGDAVCRKARRVLGGI